jgi:hypothetical protein
VAVVHEFLRLGWVLAMLDDRIAKGNLKLLDARNRLSGRFLSYATALGLTPAAPVISTRGWSYRSRGDLLQ